MMSERTTRKKQPGVSRAHRATRRAEEAELPLLNLPFASDEEVERLRELEAHAQAVIARQAEEWAEDDRRDAQRDAVDAERDLSE